VGGLGIGVAPDAEWIACRNLARNLGNTSIYLDCMQFLFAPFPAGGNPFTEGDPARGAHITNNSWGCPREEGCFTAPPLAIAVEHLRDAGQAFVVGAGNSGPSCSTIDSPALADAAISIGAIGQDGTIASFSSRGPISFDGSGRAKPDLVAPGVDVISSIPDEGYAAYPGTSMASPHVAGVIALMWSANPALIGNIDATEQILRDTATYVTAGNSCGSEGEDFNYSYGYGIVNAYGAVEAALAFTGS
jgi:subtilisin family serine protease